jgi:hypothetical protein
MALGKVRYFTGRACPEGHVAERLVSNGHCVVCGAQKQSVWRKANRKRVTDYERQRNKESPWQSVASAACIRDVRRGLSSDISADTLQLRWDFQGGKCAVTGIPMRLPRSGDRRGPWTATVDRVDSARGYTEDNVRLVCWAFNSACGNWTDNDVLRLAEAIVANKAKLRLTIAKVETP